MENIVIGIAGNKSDLIEEEKVSEEDAREYASKINASFRLTSALNNIGVEELFKELIEKYIDKFGIESLINKDINIKITKNKIVKKRKC